MNIIGLLSWFILLKESHEFLLNSLKTGTNILKTGDSEGITSVVDVKVFYTITPEIFYLMDGSPDT